LAALLDLEADLEALLLADVEAEETADAAEEMADESLELADDATEATADEADEDMLMSACWAMAMEARRATMVALNCILADFWGVSGLLVLSTRTNVLCGLRYT
jgi:hypothetical protein